MKTTLYVDEVDENDNLDWVLDCAELIRKSGTDSCRRNGVTFYLDEIGVYCYFNRFMSALPPALEDIYFSSVVITDHIEGARHIVEGQYEREGARAVVDSFVDTHGNSVAVVRITGDTLAGVNKLYIDLRQANVPVGVAWNPPAPPKED